MDPVTQQDMRTALRRAAFPRRRPALDSDAPEPAWDWQPEFSEAERTELSDLRATVVRLGGELQAARSDRDGSRRHAAELGDALRELTAARPWQRRRVVAALRERGLI